MADFNKALDYILSNEVVGWDLITGTVQEKMDYVKTHPSNWWFRDVPSDPGGATAWGITLNTAKAYGINTVEELKEMDAEKVFEIYEKGFLYHFAGIKDNRVASKLADMAVNFTGSWCKATQEVIGFKGDDLDGHYGPHTESEINNFPPLALLGLLVGASVNHYLERLRNHPEQEGERHGWITRAQKLPPKE